LLKTERPQNSLSARLTARGAPVLSMVELSTFGAKRRLWADYLDNGWGLPC